MKPVLAVALTIALLAAAPPPGVTSRTFSVPGPPSSLALSADGTMLFVGIDQHFARGGGIVAYRRDGAGLTESGRADVPGGVEALALTPDGATIVATTRVGLAWLAVSGLAPDRVTAAETLRVGAAPATNQVVISRDGRHAFFTNSSAGTLGVARISGSGATTALSLLGAVVLDRAPGGIALSPDGGTLYVTSEVAASDVASAAGSEHATCASSLGPSGTLSAIDTRKAVDDPLHAVIARAGAGCSPARVVLSSGGDIAWVSARGDDSVLAFDTARLRADAAHAFLARVAVGDVPVGLALSSDGSRLLVADSHRSRDADVASQAAVSLIDPAAVLAGRPGQLATIPSGALAREVVPTPDGGFLVTNYNAKSVSSITLPSTADRRNTEP